MKKVLDHHNPLLAAIISKARHLEQLNTLVKGQLSDDFAKEITVANLEEGCLTIGCQNAARATLLRYHCPELLTALRKQGLHGLRTIKVLVFAH